MAAHFSDHGSSTENQIYRHLAVKVLGLENSQGKTAFDDDTKNKMVDFLSNSIIEMSVYPIIEFNPNSDEKEHQYNRELTEKIESELIYKFIEKFNNEHVLNKMKKPKNFNKESSQSVEIFEHFNANI